jgi:restriction system protein
VKIKLPENSLFAILLRSPWWVSVLVALAVFGAVRFFMLWGYALFATSPFIVIAAMAAWRQLRQPGGARLARALQDVRAMPWEAFAAALERGFGRDGFAVKRVEGVADLELKKSDRLTLVSARRWKAALTGAEPLRELLAAGKRRDAAECAYVCAGELTQQAREVANGNALRLVEGVELVRLLRDDR